MYPALLSEEGPGDEATSVPALGAIVESLSVVSGAPQRVSDGKSVSPVVQSSLQGTCIRETSE